MATVAASGTQTATLTTEHSLYDAATNGVFALVVDVTNLAGVETVELRAYTKVLAGGSYVQAHSVTFAAGEAAPAVMSPPFLSPNGIKFTLTQTGGTGRAFPWAVWAV